jgi:hypothetical protein
MACDFRPKYSREALRVRDRRVPLALGREPISERLLGPPWVPSLAYRSVARSALLRTHRLIPFSGLTRVSLQSMIIGVPSVGEPIRGDRDSYAGLPPNAGRPANATLKP